MLVPNFSEYSEDDALYHIVRFFLLHTIGNGENPRGLHFKQRYTEDYTVKLESIVGKVAISMLNHISTTYIGDTQLQNSKINSIFGHPQKFSKNKYYAVKDQGRSDIVKYALETLDVDFQNPFRTIPSRFFGDIWLEPDMTLDTNILDYHWNRKINPNIWVNETSIYNDGPLKFRQTMQTFTFDDGCKLEETLLTVLMSIYIKLGFFDDVNWFVNDVCETGTIDDIISQRLQSIVYVYVGTIADLWKAHDARERMKNPFYKFKLYRNNFEKGK